MADTPAIIAQALREIAARLDALTEPEPEPGPLPPSDEITDPVNLQAVLDLAPAGSTVFLRPGAVYGATRIRRPVRLTTHGVLPSTTRVTTQEASRFAVFEPTGNLPALDIHGSDVTVENIAIRGSVDTHILCGSTSVTTVTQQPTNLTLQRLYMDGSAGAKRGIGLHSRNTIIQHCRIFGYRRVGQDTQAIAGWNGPGPYTLADNYLEAGGENVMFGGASPSIPGMVPRDILIDGNTFWKDPAWKAANYTVKNLLEFKVGEHVTIRGNTFENIWQGGQGGYAIVLTPQAQDSPNPNCIVADVMIEDNDFVNVGAGITIMGSAQIGTSLPGHTFTIRRNWFRITKGFNGGAAQGWAFFLTRGPRTVTIERNTIESDSNQIMYQDGSPVFELRCTGNLIPRSGAYGISGYANGTTYHRAAQMAVYFPGGVVTGNAWGSFPIPANLPGNLHTVSALVTLENGYGTGDFAAYGRPRP